MNDELPPGGLPPHLDDSRWDRLIEEVGPDAILVVINGWLSARLRQHCGPEDIWQETLFHAWRDRAGHEWRDLRSYRAWLLAIAKNRIRDFADRLSAKKRGGDERVVPFSALVNSGVSSLSAVLPGSSATPARIAAHRERAELMEQSLAALPEEEQAVVRLYLFEELPMEAVAERLGLSTSAAWRRFRKGTAEYSRRLDELFTLSGLQPAPRPQ